MSARPRSDWCNDCGGIEIGERAGLVLVAALVFPTPASGIPVIARPIIIGGVNYRQSLASRGFGELVNILDGDPAFLAAGTAPPFDAVQDWFRLVAAEQPVDV